MSFEALIDKVKQAEVALEAHERHAAANGRAFADTWKALWTPGRIVVAGLASGAVIGLLEPGKHLAKGRGILQMVSAAAGLFAGGSAQVAAGKAEEAADSAAQATDTAGAAMASASPVAHNGGTDPEALRRAGLL